MKLEVSWIDDGLQQVHRIEDWPDEWGVPREGDGMRWRRDGYLLIGEVDEVTYYYEGDEGYGVRVNVR